MHYESYIVFEFSYVVLRVTKSATYKGHKSSPFWDVDVASQFEWPCRESRGQGSHFPNIPNMYITS